MIQYDVFDCAIVRLIFKVEVWVICHGYFWVYANELVIDWRTCGLFVGSIALLEDANCISMGVVVVNFAFKIICRMLD